MRLNYFSGYKFLDDINNTSFKEMPIILDSSTVWIVFKEFFTKFMHF